jgi:UDP-GlcNAc:undecaprenyl-phosphate GlcNAc-1-phosphate transferase
MSLVITALVRRVAVVKGFVCSPVEDRFRGEAVPLGGGIAIFTTIAGVMLAAVITVKYLFVQRYPGWLGNSIAIYGPGFLSRAGQIAIVLICALSLFVLGLIDDIKPLGPFVKLAVEFLAALAAAGLADIRVEFFIANRGVTTLLSVLWIVLIINVFNFLDNMDGASGGIAVIVSGILFVAAALSDQVFVGGMAVIVVGTLLGFLVFNFPPAKILAGDAGSLVVGFFIALLTLRTTYYQQIESGPVYPVFMPLIVMAVPLYDFISVTLIRISQGRSPFVGDTQHFSHRLRRRGLTETQTLLTLYLATICTSLGATFLYQVNLIGAILIFTQTFMVLIIIAIFESTGKNDRTTG